VCGVTDTSSRAYGRASPFVLPEVFRLAAVTVQPSFLAARRGKLTLALLCAVAFLDFIDASIVNLALPSIRRDLHFSVQGLQWVLSGYLLTYGGFMLLGGRVGDLLGRRHILVAGTALFGASLLTGGLNRTLLIAVTSLRSPPSP
jgi:MFS family permease